MCNIKNRKVDQFEIKEIDYIIQADTVNTVTESSANDQYRTDTKRQIFFFHRYFAVEPDHSSGNQEYTDVKENSLILQYTECSSSVFKIF